MGALNGLWNRLNRSSVARNSLGYAVGNFAAAGIPFLALPFLTRILSPEDYGTYALYGVVAGALAAVVAFSSQGALLVKVTKTEDLESHRAFLTTAVVFNALLALLMLAFVMALGEPLEALANLPREWILVAVFAALGQAWLQLATTLMQTRFRPVSYSVIRLLQVLLMVGLMIGLGAGFSLGWRGQIAAHAVSLACVGAGSVVYLSLRGEMAPRLPREAWSMLVRFGAPLLPHALLSMFIPLSSRWMLGHLSGNADVGVFSVASQIAGVVSLLGASLTQALSPRLMTALAREGEAGAQRVVRGILAGAGAIGGFATLLCAGSWFLLPHFLGEAYTNVRTPLLPLAAGTAFHAAYQLLTIPLFLKERTKLLSIATMGCSLFHVGTSWFFIQSMGALGAGLAQALTYFVFMASTWALSQSVEPLPWSSLFRRTS